MHVDYNGEPNIKEKVLNINRFFLMLVVIEIMIGRL